MYTYTCTHATACLLPFVLDPTEQFAVQSERDGSTRIRLAEQDGWQHQNLIAEHMQEAAQDASSLAEMEGDI